MENVTEPYLESDRQEEGFLSAQADAFAGANAEEKRRPASFEMTVPLVRRAVRISSAHRFASTISLCGNASFFI